LSAVAAGRAGLGFVLCSVFFCWEGERGTVGFCLEGRSVCILFRGRAVSGPSRPRGHLGGHFSEQSELEHNIYERQVAKMIHKKRTASV